MESTGKLEEALAGTRRGERWEDAEGGVLVADRRVTTQKSGWIKHPPLDGWRLSDVPLLCPRCGKEAGVFGGELVWHCICDDCHLTDATHYRTRAEAEAAWRRIGRQP